MFQSARSQSQQDPDLDGARAGHDPESFEACDDVFSTSSASSVNTLEGNVSSVRGSETIIAPVRRRSQSLSGVPLKDFSKSRSASLTRCRRSSTSCEIRLLSTPDNGDVPTELVSIENKASSRKQRRRSSYDFSETYLYFGLQEADKENFPHLPIAKPIAVSKTLSSEGRRRTSSCGSYDWDKDYRPEKFQSPITASNERRVIAEETRHHATHPFTKKFELVAIKAKVLLLQDDAEFCMLDPKPFDEEYKRCLVLPTRSI